MTGILYLVATPIGNLEDITYRAIRVLNEVDLIAAEDTRNSRKLLHYFEIKTPMTSYHEYNKYEKARELVEQLAMGKNIALITDAGTPAHGAPCGRRLFLGAVLPLLCAGLRPGPGQGAPAQFAADRQRHDPDARAGGHHVHHAQPAQLHGPDLTAPGHRPPARAGPQPLVELAPRMSLPVLGPQ